MGTTKSMEMKHINHITKRWAVVARMRTEEWQARVVGKEER